MVYPWEALRAGENDTKNQMSQDEDDGAWMQRR